MRDVSLIQKELPRFTGVTQSFGQPEPIPVAANDSRVIFQQTRVALAIEAISLPESEPPLYGASILILASYDVPDKMNPSKRYVGEEIIVRSKQPINPLLEAGKTYQAYVSYSADERGGTFYIRDIIETLEEEDPRLRELDEQIRILQEKLTALRAEIARLKERAGRTPEDEARLAGLQQAIEEENFKVAGIEALIPPLKAMIESEKATIARLNTGIPAWNTRIERVRTLGQAMERQEASQSLSWNWMYRVRDPYEACERIWGIIDQFSRKSTCSNNKWALMVTIGGIRYTGWYCRPSGGDIPNAQVVDTLVYYAEDRIRDLENQIREHTTTLADLEAQLRDRQAELEYTQRRLGDAIAALKRADLEIRRAIALRQAEVEAAQARYELELRTLDNLRATYNTLLKEIELARIQAIAEAARQREEVIRAAEAERLRIAEEQRIKAEEAERKALETTGTSREEYLEEMRRALDIAKEAQEAAIASAKEREEIAKEIATKEAELAQMELELRDLRKKQTATEERKEEAEKEVAGLPTMPTWGWAALGITATALSAVGIGLALKKKKRKK